MKKTQKSFRRIITLCLLVTMLLPVLAACSKGTDTGTTALNTDGGGTGYTVDLPIIDANGYEFRILDFDNFEQTLEDDPITVVDQAVYKRNELVKSRFNIDITAETKPYATWWDNTALVQRLASTEAPEYDLVTLVFKDAYAEILVDDVVAACDLPDIIDMTKPWHMTSLNDHMTVDGVALMDFTAFDVRPGGNCIIFNKDMVDLLNLDDPYVKVKDGTWTYDDMWAMAKAAIADLDNNPEWTEDDRYGFFNNWHQMTTFVHMGTGEMLVKLNDGTPSLNKSEGLVSVFMDAAEELSQDGMMFDVYGEWQKDSEASNTRGRQSFTNDQCMFVLGHTNYLTEFGDMESDYGILPYPKKTVDQSRYYINNSAANSLILTCHSDIEFVAIVKEALAVESLNYYHPAYYELTIQNRYLRDEEDLEILKIITDSSALDMGNTAWWVEIRNPLAEEVFEVGGTNFASKLQSLEPKVKGLISDLTTFVNSKKG